VLFVVLVLIGDVLVVPIVAAVGIHFHLIGMGVGSLRGHLRRASFAIDCVAEDRHVNRRDGIIALDRQDARVDRRSATERQAIFEAFKARVSLELSAPSLQSLLFKTTLDTA
jgi:hypothetical protein